MSFDSGLFSIQSAGGEKDAHDLYLYTRDAFQDSDTSSYLSAEDKARILDDLGKLIHSEKVRYDVASNLSKVWY